MFDKIKSIFNKKEKKTKKQHRKNSTLQESS